jgi:hypothetical protein
MPRWPATKTHLPFSSNMEDFNELAARRPPRHATALRVNRITPENNFQRTPTAPYATTTACPSGTTRTWRPSKSIKIATGSRSAIPSKSLKPE